MSAQTAVQAFMLKKENAIAVEKCVFAINAHLKVMQLESGQEDAIFVLIVQVPRHAALNFALVKCVNFGSDLMHLEMTFLQAAALNDPFYSYPINDK